MKNLLVLLLFCFSSLQTLETKQFVDPHSMDVDSYKYSRKANTQTYGKTQVETTTSNSGSGSEVEDLYKECSKLNENDASSYIYLKRLVSLLLYSANLEQSDGINHFGSLKMTLPKESYLFLVKFSKGSNIDDDSLRKLDSILSESLKKSFVSHYSDIAFSYIDQIYIMIYNRTTAGLGAIILVLGIIYKLFKENFSLWYITKYLIFISFIIDFMIVYLELMEEYDNYNMDIVTGAACDTGDLSWTQYFSYLSGGKQKCGKKFVSPLIVFQYQMKTLIIKPLAYLGQGIGGFARETFKFGARYCHVTNSPILVGRIRASYCHQLQNDNDIVTALKSELMKILHLRVSLPFGINIVLWPVLLIFILLMSCVFLTKGNIKVSVFHLFDVQFGGGKKESKTENMLSEKCVSKILDATTQRKQIEDVKTSPKKERKQLKHKKEKKERERESKSSKNNFESEIKCETENDINEKI